MPHKTFRAVLLLIGAHLACQSGWHGWDRNDSIACPAPHEEARVTAHGLSPISVFQDRPLTDEVSDKRRQSISRDMKLLTAVYSIGTQLLIDDVPATKIERAIDFQFSDRRDFLDGIDVGGVRCAKGIVRIPYTRDGKKYLIRVIPNPSAWAVARQKCQRITPEMFDITATEAIDELAMTSP